MKTTIKLFTLTAMITLFFTVITTMAQIDFTSDDEAYINDIPFNTETVAGEVQFDRTYGFIMEEEDYIDDIPFDTKAIAYDICCDRELKEKYSFEEEAYIDDIPFDTEKIYNQLLRAGNTSAYSQNNAVHCNLTQKNTKTSTRITL
jgi:hypothetical protein